MRITGRPLAGPASTYPVFSTPALTCRTGPNWVLAGCPRRAGADAAAALAVRAGPSNGSRPRRHSRRRDAEELASVLVHLAVRVACVHSSSSFTIR